MAKGHRRSRHGAHVEDRILAAARRAQSGGGRQRPPRPSPGASGVAPPRFRLVSGPGRRRSDSIAFTLWVVLLALLTFAAVWTWAGWRAREAGAPAPIAEAAPRMSFSICAGRARFNCVVDGDTFWMAGEKIRILDIDTPELSPPRCTEEERLGLAAKRRLAELLNGGGVTLARGIGEDDRDRYGRLLRTVSVDGRSVGDALIAEGLARPYGSGRRAWC